MDFNTGHLEGEAYLDILEPYVVRIKRETGLLVGVQTPPHHDLRRYDDFGGRHPHGVRVPSPGRHRLPAPPSTRHRSADPRSQTGVLFHMLGAASEHGRIGVVAIGDSRAHARQLHDAAVARLDRETAAG